jgi:hypothetical protein
VPRPGYYFCSVDYAALELCCLAQMCLWVVGWSRMADVINATKDPGLLHTSFGARMIGPAVAGLLVDRVGVAPAFGLNGLSFVAVILALAAMRTEGLPRDREGTTVRQDIAAGIRFAVGTPLVALILSLLLVVSLFVINDAGTYLVNARRSSRCPTSLIFCGSSPKGGSSSGTNGAGFGYPRGVWTSRGKSLAFPPSTSGWPIAPAAPIS